MVLALATSKGLAACRRERHGWTLTHRALEDRHATSVAAGTGFLLVGTRDGIYRSADEGRSWEPPAPRKPWGQGTPKD